MANGSDLPDPSWWHGLGALITGGLAGLGIGRRRRAPKAEDGDAQLHADHDRMRADFRDLIDVIREEGREQRKALYTLGDSIRGRLESIDKAQAVILERIGRNHG